jgi:hypothetical protein
VVVFPLVQTVRPDAKHVQTYTYENFNSRDFQDFSKRSRLWKVDFMPCKDAQPSDDPYRLTRRLLELPGYLHFLDEQGGFLMTWISERAWNEREVHGQMHVSASSTGILPKSNRVVTPVWTNVWKKNISDRKSGAKIPDSDVCGRQRSTELERHEDGQVRVNFTARLDVYRLLEDILLRRPNLVPGYDQISSSFPLYAYDLIAVSDGGRAVELVVGFEVGKDKGSIGVAIRVDILTQAYQELQWGKGGNVQYDPASDSVKKLSTWCSKMALQRRMRQQRVGPYSAHPDHPSDWGWLCQDNFAPGLERQDGWDPAIWGPLTKNLESSRRHVEQLRHCGMAGLSQSLVFPDCELADNRAVISGLPVFSMKGSSAPTELVYG